jgi:phage RecT family recombinase
MNAIATQQAGPLALARSFDEMQKTMLGYLAKSRDKIGGVVDERSIIAAVGAMRANPKLLECTPQSVFLGIVQAGSYGWMCDGITGHAALVPFKSKAVNGVPQPSKCTLIAGYKGLMDLVRRTGQCEPTMESVHDGDTYQYRGRFQEPLHIRSGDANRRQRPIIAVYVLGVFKGGMVKCFSWTREECIAHRDAHAKNWQNAVKWSKGDNDPQLRDNVWHEDNPAFAVMCMKSVMRHAINRGEFPISVKDLRLLAQEDELLEGAVVMGGMSQEEVAGVVEFDSPAGYSETLHDPGDDIAADAAAHLAEQTLVDAKTIYIRQLAACKTVAEVDQCVSDAMNDPEGADIRQEGEEKKAAMTFLESQRTPRKR